MTASQTVERIRQPQQSLSAAASLEHMTGGARGTVTWLHDRTIGIAVGPKTTIRTVAPQSVDAKSDPVAILHRSDAGYVISATGLDPVWVNGGAVDVRPLVNGDMIEFGDRGPISRFHLHRDGARNHHAVAEIVGDAFDYLRVSRQPPALRLWRALAGVMRRLFAETTVLFRSMVVATLLILVGVAYYQVQLNDRLRAAIHAGDTRLDRITAGLMRAQQEALTLKDLAALRNDFSQRLTRQQYRLSVLEKAPGAIRRIIAAAAPSVAFLQGAYGFKERQSGRMLRYVMGAAGGPILSPFGQPMLSVEGDGPVAQLQFFGTGFALADRNVIITNRHIAAPWEGEAGAALAARDELEPVFVRFVAYFPGLETPIDIVPAAISNDADLALLRPQGGNALGVLGLHLSSRDVQAGDDVVVLGFPTGLRSLLAQSGDAFVERLQNEEVTDLWDIAERLAKAGYIAPLASRGIVGQTTMSSLAYDADTTHGGSGGPVLDRHGDVIAVNAAILPEYGGSNLGVPIRWLRDLLHDAP